MDESGGGYQRVLNTILIPAGIKVGGLPEELFVKLTEEERDAAECAICFQIANDVRQCRNRHNFCASCIFAWSMTTGANCDKCPVCRAAGPYHKNMKLNNELMEKRVQCLVETCKWRGPLKFFLTHRHGFDKFNNRGQDILDVPFINRPPGHRSNHRRVGTPQGDSPGVDFNSNPTPTQDVSLPEITRANMYQFDISNERLRRERRFTQMRAQLQHGRARLNSMMGNFHQELERGRRSLEDFHREREAQNHANVEEVNQLGRHLAQVANNLMSLLNSVDSEVRQHRTAIQSASRQDDHLLTEMDSLTNALTSGQARRPPSRGERTENVRQSNRSVYNRSNFSRTRNLATTPNNPSSSSAELPNGSLISLSDSHRGDSSSRTQSRENTQVPQGEITPVTERPPAPTQRQRNRWAGYSGHQTRSSDAAAAHGRLSRRSQGNSPRPSLSELPDDSVSVSQHRLLSRRDAVPNASYGLRRESASTRPGTPRQRILNIDWSDLRPPANRSNARKQKRR